jgi:uncharacterized membrane protein YgcG
MNMRLLGLTVLVLGIFFVARIARADEFSISGNAAGSENSIKIESSSHTTVNQQNSMDVKNTVDASANTGGNTADNGSVKTGDANIFVKIKNFFNSNTADVKCCTTPEPKPTQNPTNPTPPAGGGDGGGGSSSGSSDGGSSGGAGGGGSSSGGQVLGLSATSGESTNVFYVLGSLCLAFGSVLLGTKKFLA